MKLSNYDLIIINTSAGKDSLVSIWEICRLADLQNYPKEKIVLSHQDLGRMEWQGTKDLAIRQAEFFGLKIEFSKYRNKDGQELSLLDYVERRGKWPSSEQRYCTSDFKRGPGSRIVTKLSKDLGKCSVLHVFGFRKQESTARKQKARLAINTRLTTKRRKVVDFLPIHAWKESKVWKVIKDNALPYHEAYDLGMPRLSCCFCILSTRKALKIAGQANPELLETYVALEEKIGHSFKQDLSLKEIQDEILEDLNAFDISLEGIKPAIAIRHLAAFNFDKKPKFYFSTNKALAI